MTAFDRRVDPEVREVRRLEVITGALGRRRWSAEAKARIVAESLAAGVGGDVWFFDKPVRNDLHPTMKPVALVERAIRNSSKTRDIVLDTFRRLGLDPDRLREGGAPGAPGRARSEVRRHDHPALAGVQWRRRGPGWRRPVL